MEYSRKKLDLLGQRFGHLTVIAPAENIGGRTAWLCQCDCGGRAVAATRYLRSGHTRSCGCLPKATYVDGTCVEILRAKTVRKNNTSGVPGVDWLRKKQRWRATICFQGKRHYLGSYINFADAVAARRVAEVNLQENFLWQYDAQHPHAAP